MNKTTPVRPTSTLSKARELPDELRREYETFFSTDLSDVRIHEGPEAPALGTLAFTTNSQVFFAPGCYRPDLAPGRRLIAHELTHVLQQREGRAQQPGNGVRFLDDPELEAEAERVAEAFMLGRRSADIPRCARRDPATAVVQAAKVSLVDSSKTSYSLFKNPYEKFLADYTLIQRWMTTPGEFLPALRSLEGELSKSTDVKKKLTSVLHRRELQFGINTDGAPMYTAVLNGPEFVAMSKKGVLPKDHVTPEHGEFTHRMHWYILFHNATQGFTRDWSNVFYNSPATLLKNAPLRAYGPPKTGWPNPYGVKDSYETTTFSMWEALFDRRPFDVAYTCDVDWISCPEMFMALLLPNAETGNIAGYRKFREVPDKKDSYYTMSDKFPVLSAELALRYRKRSGEMSLQGNTQTNWAVWYNMRKAGNYTKPEDDVMDEVRDPTRYSYWEHVNKGTNQRSRAVLVRNKI